MSNRAVRGPSALLVVAAVACAIAAPAGAEVVSGQPDESIQRAYPIAQGHTYPVAFEDTSYDDVDYLAFTVTEPNQTLEFTVANSTQSCNDPNDAGCPVYATLMDSNDQQVGGDASDAGTIATSGDTETLDWTFTTPGTYYLLMESDGDLAPGSPSYTVQLKPVGGGGGAKVPPQPPLVRSFKAPPRQRGAKVAAMVRLGRPATLVRATLLAPRPGRRPAFIVRSSLTGVPAGSHRMTLGLTSAYRTVLKRKHRLSLVVKLLVESWAGERVTRTRRVLITSAAQR